MQRACSSLLNTLRLLTLINIPRTCPSSFHCFGPCFLSHPSPSPPLPPILSPCPPPLSPSLPPSLLHLLPLPLYHLSLYHFLFCLLITIPPSFISSSFSSFISLSIAPYTTTISFSLSHIISPFSTSSSSSPLPPPLHPFVPLPSSPSHTHTHKTVTQHTEALSQRVPVPL